LRLFVAILLDQRVRRRLGELQDRLRHSCEGVRWVKPEQLHLTVQFLGDVDDGDVALVAEALREAATRAEPLVVTVSGCGCFPATGLVRVVWAGMTDTSGSLGRAVDAIRRALGGVGFAPDRRAWSAHITLGRVRDGRTSDAIRRAMERYRYDALEQPVDSVVLMSSVLSASGSAYTEVCRATLGKG